MNKKTLLKNLKDLKPLFIAIILLAGLSFASAVNWTVPDISMANTARPVDEGTISPAQEKKGQLTVGALSNSAHNPVVTYSPFKAGSNHLDVKTYFYGPLNLFSLIDSSAPDYVPLCTAPSGKVKLCADKVLFEPVQDSYYTATNAVTYSTVTGAVKYEIDPLLTCTTVATAGTNWGNGTTLSGTNSSYSVTFNNWGTYVLSMDCTNSKTYSATIDIKGRIISDTSAMVGPHIAGTQNGFTGVQKYYLGASSKNIEVKAQGGGAGGSSNPQSYGGIDGMPAFAHVTTSSSWTPNTQSNTYGANYNSDANLVHAGGGYASQSSTSWKGKGGNKITYSSSLQNITKSNGSDPSGSNGGCPGSNPNSCNGEAGTGGYGMYPGGGGAYVSGTYTTPANSYIYVYNGDWGGGYPPSSNPDGKPASMIIEWKN